MPSRTTGVFLASEFQELDQIADEHDLNGLTSFADRREVPPDFNGPPWELDEVMGPCDDWFPAEAGRAAFTALARLLREQPAVANRLECPEEIVEELEDLARVLSEAVRAGVEFRMELR